MLTCAENIPRKKCTIPPLCSRLCGQPQVCSCLLDHPYNTIALKDMIGGGRRCWPQVAANRLGQFKNLMFTGGLLDVYTTVPPGATCRRTTTTDILRVY